MKKRGKKIEFDWENEEQEEIIWVSKSEIKRDAEILKKMGEKLIALTPTKLAQVPLDETMLDAVQLAQRLQKEAKRRQIQYIGKLLRNIDTTEIEAALDKLENKHHQQQALLHKLESLRDRLVEQGDSELSQFMSDYPDADRQHLRTLIRAAQKERTLNKPAKAYRDIFQYLKSFIDA